MECIILAGGKGSRLSSVVNDVPKCMADINGRPFLEYLLSYLEMQGVYNVILSLGYKHEMVIDWLKNKAFLCKVSWVIEKESLGTGGAVKLALNKSKNKQVIILNGDTLFSIDLKKILAANVGHKVTLALKPMKEYDRYGSVIIDDAQQVIAFTEKSFQSAGLINGGVYVLNKEMEDFSSYDAIFSFEKEFLEPNATEFNAVVFDDYFIDIGIPEDYEKAQSELKFDEYR